MEQNYQQKKGLVMREVCGERVIIGEGTEAINFNKLISLNETAAFLWQEAGRQQQFSAQSLADALCAEYEVEKETALNDTNNILNDWKEADLIELA